MGEQPGEEILSDAERQRRALETERDATIAALRDGRTVDLERLPKLIFELDQEVDMAAMKLLEPDESANYPFVELYESGQLPADVAESMEPELWLYYHHLAAMKLNNVLWGYVEVDEEYAQRLDNLIARGVALQDKVGENSNAGLRMMQAFREGESFEGLLDEERGWGESNQTVQKMLEWQQRSPQETT